MRPRLFGLAYRMLGSAAEAEDVVQDAWLRWQGTDRDAVNEPAAFLVTTTTRLAINVAQAARTQRETYIGPWLPEPIDTRADPHVGTENGEALGMALLQLLEALTPTERAAYVLREAFDYSHREIADILGLEEANVRQLAARAKKHVGEERRRPVDTAALRPLFDAFVVAARAGDVKALEALFAADVASYTDGNGIVKAARVPVLGRERVAKFIGGFAGHFWDDVDFEVIEANGAPAMLLRRGGTPFALGTLDASPDGITKLFWVMSPPKLARIAG